ncbi:MAG: type II toxin-antitoxin system prevent-host-death family antitoxin, partial [Candidatus Limnocylindrales bacterium]
AGRQAASGTSRPKMGQSRFIACILPGKERDLLGVYVREVACGTLSPVARIGMRDLRRNTGEYVRRAGKGELIEIARWGRPVAQLTPLPLSISEPHHSIADAATSLAKLRDEDEETS